MNEDIKQTVQSILNDLDAKIRQEVKNWWNDVRQQKPETLPWFSNGLKGFLRKLYYNNRPENPDWNQYKVESTKISLSEYVSIKKDLTSVLMENAPVGSFNVVDSLISKLMPLIQNAINQISSLNSNSNIDSSEPKRTPEPQSISEPQATEEPEQERTPEPQATTQSQPTEEPDDVDSNEKESIFKSLSNYASNGDPMPLIKKLKQIGIPVSKVRKKLVIDAKQSEQGKEEVAAALWDLFDYLSDRSDDELLKIGLLKDDLRSVDMNYWKRFLKGSDDLFMGIKISKEIYDALADHIGKNAFSEQVKRYIKMLRENKKETRDIIMSRKLNINDKKSFFLETIKQR